MLIRKLFRTAWSYKSQFISMVIMIAIGIGIFVGFNIQWNSLETDAFDFLEDTKYADYRLYSESGFTNENIEAVKDIDGVDTATRYFSANIELKGMGKSVTLNVSEDYNVSTMFVISGAIYTADSDGIWLSDKFADANGIKIGDMLTLAYMGKEISGEVVGLCKSGENLICVADENQLMPDFESHGFAYISAEKYEKALGFAFYPQINIISDMDKESLEEAVKDATGTTLLVTTKNEHVAYAGIVSEAEEGKTMGLILPVLFLAIAILTMVLEIHDNYLLVEPEAGMEELKSADKFEIPLDDVDNPAELQVDDSVLIVYDGEILETYPAKLGEVYSVGKMIIIPVDNSKESN